jgi:K(+)-stimulated pyrophosphate-energized sodium pump
MTNNQSGANDGSKNGLHMWVAILLALLLLGLWLMGYGPGGSKCQPVTATAMAEPAAPPVKAMPPPVEPATAPPVAVAAAGAAAAASTAALATVASVPAAKLYFAVDKTDLPDTTNATLAQVVAYLKANSDAKASVSGFHDPSGSAARNEELALNRARAVRGALDQLGIAKERVMMQKPQQTSGTGKPAEARRVEVTVVR